MRGERKAEFDEICGCPVSFDLVKYALRSNRSYALYTAKPMIIGSTSSLYWMRHTVLGSPGVGRFLLRPTEAGREKPEGLPVLPDCRDARLASSS